MFCASCATCSELAALPRFSRPGVRGKSHPCRSSLSELPIDKQADETILIQRFKVRNVLGSSYIAELLRDYVPLERGGRPSHLLSLSQILN